MDEYWQQFLRDSERAIGESAPKEPSAQERMDRAERLRAGDRDASQRQAGQGQIEAVGELYDPEDPWRGPAWQDMDARARRQLIGRVLGLATAIAVVLGAMSQLSGGSGSGVNKPGDMLSTQSDDVLDQVPTGPAAPAPARPASPLVTKR
ncbi:MULTISPECIES: hypothetical protein [Streptomyces]|uniref:hypothetical protein n=1 Tax=Streptomyces TaxID=1883 RepID=UPI00069188E8|nr:MULTISPECIES: hypothetical protein [Streptomyces]